MMKNSKKSTHYNRPWRRLYDTARYKRLRLTRLNDEPLCRMCRERFGRVRPATVCDHVQPHRGDVDLFYDYTNTQSLCKECHDIHKQRMEIGAPERQEFGADGYPLGEGGSKSEKTIA